MAHEWDWGKRHCGLAFEVWWEFMLGVGARFGPESEQFTGTFILRVSLGPFMIMFWTFRVKPRFVVVIEGGSGG